MHVECGEGEEILGILGHLDIVPIFNRDKWDSDPFQLVEKNDALYGRGVNDDKGPMIGALYALKILNQAGVKFNRRVRLILGGAEETTWECMKHYFKFNEQPAIGFSPDGNFPIVNGEKGINYYKYRWNLNSSEDGENKIVAIETKKEDGFVCDYVKVVIESNNTNELRKNIKYGSIISEENNNIVVEYNGIRALSRNPQRGENALFNMGKDLKNISKLNSNGILVRDILDKYFIDSIYGEKVDLQFNDNEMGTTTMCLMSLLLENETLELNFDFRYPKGISKETVLTRFKDIAIKENCEMTITKDLDLLYVNPESELIKSLSIAYENVLNKKVELISKGAASYARVLDNGVAFGPSFENDKPNSHEANENIKLSTLFTAIEIYCEAIYRLACE